MDKHTIAALIALGFGYLIALGIFLGVKTKRGRKFLGIDE
jgi:hypothetical protein